MSLQSFLNWCYHSKSLGVVRDSMYGIPVVQSFHLLGLTLLLGTIVFLNFRLLGWGFRRMTLVSVAEQMRPWVLTGLLLTVFTGIVIFLTDPVRYATSTPFRIKMACLCAAILYHFTVFRKVSKSEIGAPLRNGIVAFFSLALWFAVGWAGRAIAFFR